MTSEDIQTHSQLCELIHKKLDYEIILFAAMHSIIDKITQARIDVMKTELKKFLDNEDI